jgi:hypothetical protein
MKPLVVVTKGLGKEARPWLEQLRRASGAVLIDKDGLHRHVLTAIRARPEARLAEATSDGRAIQALVDEMSPFLERSYFHERGWGHQLLLVEDNWPAHMGPADACILDLTNSAMWRWRLDPWEERAWRARRLAEVRHRMRDEALREFPKERILYLPSRISDDERVQRSLRFLMRLRLNEEPGA